ncbi:MAG TPA: hypothetical protein VFX64_01915 [Candidatus Nitrosotalea sp.]|nr:hypothetical protein [Candidatus Nitrosotalea sp.]
MNYAVKDDSFASAFQNIDEKNLPINVTKFMSIAENSTEFKEKVNGYDHYSLATVIIPKLYPQNTANATLEYNLVYGLYKNHNDCSYEKALIVTLNIQLQVMRITEYSPYDVPTGYPLPLVSCPMGWVPAKVTDYNRLAGVVPWVPPLQQLNYGISAKNVGCINGTILVLKAEDGSPACMSPNTAQKLIKRGWAKEIVSELVR